MNHWYTIKAADVRGAADISIYEEIGGFGVTAKQFAEDLKALGDVSHINLRIHSP
ncbi:Clp protease ClpP, partial [Escherichia coli]